MILGGYGNFGKRIAENLCLHKAVTIYLAGRNSQRAERICQQLSLSTGHTQLRPLVIDINSADFEHKLIQLDPDLVIHTSGPFQGQGFRVPQACIKTGSHYIDLADDRRFVCDIHQLNELAQGKNLLIVSGASSVPGLSSTVIELIGQNYAKLSEIDIAIAPGNKAERGEATLRGILSYTGKSFPAYLDGRWQSAYGWMSPRKVDFGAPIGKRWLANVDVPDLELFPKLYPGVKTVRFQAGLELPILHHTMVAMAWMAKHKLIGNWAKLTRSIFKMSHWFSAFGTDIGGMRVLVRGINKDNKRQQNIWYLTAEDNIGPFIPTLPSIILANKLITNKPDTNGSIKFGAMACLNLFSLEEFEQYARPLGIYHRMETNIG